MTQQNQQGCRVGLVVVQGLARVLLGLEYLDKVLLAATLSAHLEALAGAVEQEVLVLV
jgi:hypothetical protein